MALADFGSDELVEYFDYLDDLRESGTTNMFGAAAYLRDAFDLNRGDASDILQAWMRTFDDRPVDDRVFAALDAAGA